MHVYTCIIRFMHDTAKRSAIQGLLQKRSVRAVVFDYGNVLCLEQTLEDMKGMALVCGIPDEGFSVLYWKLRPRPGISMDLPTGQRVLANKNCVLKGLSYIGRNNILDVYHLAFG